jgi:NAD(P)H dehydrogenase (quinone)
MLMITGATGHLGTAVADHLLAQGDVAFSILSRDPAKSKRYAEQGIAVRMGDFDDPASLRGAFAGVSKLLLISSRSLDRTAQQRSVVDAAVAAGVRHIVYTGLSIRDIATSEVRNLMQSHFDTEDHIRALGVEYTFLRNTMYAEALVEIVPPAWPEHGIALPAGVGSVPYALRREMGEAAANVLRQDHHRMQTYDITGPAALSFQDVAETLGELTGHSVTYTPMNAETFAQQLRDAQMPEFMVDLTVGTLLDVKARQYEVHSDALAMLLGRPPTAPRDMLAEVFGLQRPAG